MPTVTGTLKDAGGNPGSSLDIYLCDDNGRIVTDAYVNGTTIAGRTSPDVSATDGTWSATLTANSLITPAGTAYRQVGYAGGRAVLDRYLTVTNEAGPLVDVDIVSAAPAALADSALSAHTSDDTIHGGGALLASSRLTTSFSIAAGSAAAGGVVTGFAIEFEQPAGDHLVAVHAVIPVWGSVTNDEDLFELRRNSLTPSAANGGVRDRYISRGNLTWEVRHLVDIDFDPPVAGTTISYDLFCKRASGTGGVGLLVDTIGFGSFQALMWAQTL